MAGKTAAKRGKAGTGAASARVSATDDDVRFAGYPAVVLYDKVGKGRKPLKQLLWGDWMRVLEGPDPAGNLKVHARGVDGVVKDSEVSRERLLEVIFVDIGQGDGCLLVTPDDRHVIIDAGAGDNMLRFLRWRYGQFKKAFAFDAAVISHSDEDHYGGFRDLFAEKLVRFKAVYTNGLMERVSADDRGLLGEPVKSGKALFIDSMVTDLDALRAFVADPELVGRKQFPGMLKKALAGNKMDDFRQLSVRDRFLPGFGEQSAVRIEVLGPVTERVKGRQALRWFGDPGKTKNGHSVVLRAVFGEVSILLGGDLNIPSEGLLLKHHAGAKSLPESEQARAELALAARRVLQSDVAKSCHHGSADFSRGFLSAVNPCATVISSGDDEAYSHPRADALGTIGKYSRGVRPMIFSTELARSAPERIKHPAVLHARLDKLIADVRVAKSEQDEARLKKEIAAIKSQLDRSVAVYGAINVRTDGRRIIVAQKLEAPRTKNKEWDMYRLERGASGDFELVSQHETGDGAEDD